VSRTATRWTTQCATHCSRRISSTLTGLATPESHHDHRGRLWRCLYHHALHAMTSTVQWFAFMLSTHMSVYVCMCVCVCVCVCVSVRVCVSYGDSIFGS
jgi:hypothetical protein